MKAFDSWSNSGSTRFDRSQTDFQHSRTEFGEVFFHFLLLNEQGMKSGGHSKET
jgi:hypothetical protein